MSSLADLTKCRLGAFGKDEHAASLQAEPIGTR